MFNSQERNNDPNPILVAVRYVSEKHGMAPEETVNLANLWLRAPRYYESNLGVKAAKSHKAHAYKVLTRLVNIFGTENDEHERAKATEPGGGSQ